MVKIVLGAAGLLTAIWATSYVVYYYDAPWPGVPAMITGILMSMASLATLVVGLTELE